MALAGEEEPTHSITPSSSLHDSCPEFGFTLEELNDDLEQ